MRREIFSTFFITYFQGCVQSQVSQATTSWGDYPISREPELLPGKGILIFSLDPGHKAL